MKAELRIGNYVDYNDRVYQIDSGRFIDQSINNCMPIPLTEDWLIKFGFNFKFMGAGGAVCTRHSGHWYKNNNPYFAGSNKVFDIFLQFGEGVEIEYVHQLQNLYFALTGEELKLKS